MEILYDLVQDPAETTNMVGMARYQPILKELQSRLRQWMRETDAIEQFWNTRGYAKEAQKKRGKTDQSNRSRVTSGKKINCSH